MKHSKLDVAFCREQFPPLANGWAYFDNAGGSFVPHPVIDRMTAYMRDCQCQPAWAFPAAREAHRALERSQRVMAEMLNAEIEEIVIGPSTTMNVYVLAHALRPGFQPGDEIVVTEQDHEANGGAWRRLAEHGVVIREWSIDPVSGELELDGLDALLGERTRLVCFPHVSNIVGSVNDVAAVVERAHAVDAMVCVDGVAAVAHHLPDVRALDVDFYLFSTYKLYGPHLGVLYVRRDRLDACANQNHFFHEQGGAAKLNPGGFQYEVVAGLAGVADYLEAVDDRHFGAGDNTLRGRVERVFELFREHESRLMRPLVDYLARRGDIRLIGRAEANAERRAPTFSLAFDGRPAREVAEALGGYEIAAAHGHFYAYRCVEALGLDPGDGVVRISMVHYNAQTEVDRLIAALEAI